MTRSAWLRLAFVLAVTAYLFGLVELAFWAGWAVALGVSLGGVLLAGLLAEDWSERASSTTERPEVIRSGAQHRRDLLRAAGVEDNGQ